jgi:hypothetical protein
LYLEERSSGRSATRDDGRGESGGARGERERRRRRRRAAAEEEEEARGEGRAAGATAARRMGKTSRSKEAAGDSPPRLFRFRFFFPLGFSISGDRRRLVTAALERGWDCGNRNVKRALPVLTIRWRIM